MKTLLVTLILVSGVAFGNKPVEKQKNEDPKGNETQLSTKQKTTLDEKALVWTATNNFMGESQNQMSAVKTEEFKSKKDENLPKVADNEPINFGSSPILMSGNFDFSKKGRSVKVCCLPCPQMTPCE